VDDIGDTNAARRAEAADFIILVEQVLGIDLDRGLGAERIFKPDAEVDEMVGIDHRAGEVDDLLLQLAAIGIVEVETEIAQSVRAINRGVKRGARLQLRNIGELVVRAINAVIDEATNTVSYVLTDLSSRNGTLLNGEKVRQETLQNGDKITIGEHILRFEFLDEIDREFHRQIHRLLSHDDLTGLLSSRSFFSELRRESARAKAENRPFCVIMMDVDFFKNVNDTYGHLTGSKTLEEIEEYAQQNQDRLRTIAHDARACGQNAKVLD